MSISDQKLVASKLPPTKYLELVEEEWSMRTYMVYTHFVPQASILTTTYLPYQIANTKLHLYPQPRSSDSNFHY
jgi:hypothetical protein